MKRQEKKEVLNRFNYLIGHLQGNRKMVVDGKYCIDIIKQNEAVMAAIKQFNYLILENHLNTCVTEAIKGKNEKDKKKKKKTIKQLKGVENVLSEHMIVVDKNRKMLNAAPAKDEQNKKGLTENV